VRGFSFAGFFDARSVVLAAKKNNLIWQTDASDWPSADCLGREKKSDGQLRKQKRKTAQQAAKPMPLLRSGYCASCELFAHRLGIEKVTDRPRTTVLVIEQYAMPALGVSWGRTSRLGLSENPGRPE